MIRELQIVFEGQRDPISDTVNEPLERRKRILVIDDSADSLSLVKSILEIGNYDVLTENGGKAALKTLTEIEKPDLILLDVQMKGMTGLEFLNMLEECRPEILAEVPVVFLTGMKEVPSSRAVGFIRKPIMIDSFLRETRRYIGEGTRSHDLS
jgi:CheY-like chemotaxis protein